MLKRTQRISRKDLLSKQFPFSFNKTSYFSFKIRKNTLGAYRFAFVISKKIDKRAVVRNSLKRRMSEAVANLTPIHSGYDIVFLPKKAISSLSSGELENLLKEVLYKYTRV